MPPLFKETRRAVKGQKAASLSHRWVLPSCYLSSSRIRAPKTHLLDALLPLLTHTAGNNIIPSKLHSQYYAFPIHKFAYDKRQKYSYSHIYEKSSAYKAIQRCQ